ncbi:hypothetical protein KEM52_003030 [Ascosphaera acerosa]|nr:hypothetical protein KEM52_003030 [Ascosphaera acerosa]
MDRAESTPTPTPTPAPQQPPTVEASPGLSTAASSRHAATAAATGTAARPAKRVKRDTKKTRDTREGTVEDGSSGTPTVNAVTGTTAAAAAAAAATATTGASGGGAAAARRRRGAAAASVVPSLQLGLCPPVWPKETYPDDKLPPRARQLSWATRRTNEALGRSWDFFEVVEKLSNKNGYRYTCAVDDSTSHFPRIRFRSAEAPPYHARLSFEDSTVEMLFSEDGLAATTNGPWHSARANVCAREGTYYYEARVISGVVAPPQSRSQHHSRSQSQSQSQSQAHADGSRGPAGHGHVRLGFSRREAELDVNVGHDCYGYGIRDVNGEVVNRMRCRQFMPPGESICEGDVVGMLITLPPLSLHRKVVEGTYDPAVDDPRVHTPDCGPIPTNIVRDRIPFHDKKTGDLLWQQSYVNPTKHLRDYAFNLRDTPTTSGGSVPSPTNTEDPSLRTLPGSKITIYKNGVRMGDAFEGLFAFLPPATRSAPAEGNHEHVERENADDGMIGYFPTVSCFRGGAVECRFEAPWWIGPPTDDYPGETIRFFGDRFNEQIADDVVADIVDEIDAEMKGWNVTELMLASAENPVQGPSGQDQGSGESGSRESGSKESGWKSSDGSGGRDVPAVLADGADGAGHEQLHSAPGREPSRPPSPLVRLSPDAGQAPNGIAEHRSDRVATGVAHGAEAVAQAAPPASPDRLADGAPVSNGDVPEHNVL